MLNPDDAAALYARMYGWTYHEIAEMFGISKEEANDRSRRALDYVKDVADRDDVLTVHMFEGNKRGVA